MSATANLHTEKATLPTTPPFDFDKSLAFLGDFNPTRGAHTLGANALTKAVYAEGTPVVFRVTSSGTTEQPRLECTLFSEEPLSTSVREAALDYASFFLSLDEDLRPFYEIASRDEAFAPVLERLYGYHQVKFGTPFEATCWAILSTRNPMPAAQRTKQAIVERFSQPLTVDGTAYTPFPEPRMVIEAPPDELQSIMNNERKASYILNAAQAFSEVSSSFLRHATYEELERWLLSIKGVGEWSSQFVLLRAFGRLDRVPLSEKRLVEVINRVYGRGHALTVAEIEQIAAAYGPWKGYWAHYLRASAQALEGV